MLPDLVDYERFIYSLPDTYPSIRRSTLVVIRRGPAIAEVTGTVEFDDEIMLTVWEDLNFARGVIQGYSYAVGQGDERFYWYDPQPHPNDPNLGQHIPSSQAHSAQHQAQPCPRPWLEFRQPKLALFDRRDRARIAGIAPAVSWTKVQRERVSSCGKPSKPRDLFLAVSSTCMNPCWPDRGRGGAVLHRNCPRPD